MVSGSQATAVQRVRGQDGRDYLAPEGAAQRSGDLPRQPRAAPISRRPKSHMLAGRVPSDPNGLRTMPTSEPTAAGLARAAGSRDVPFVTLNTRSFTPDYNQSGLVPYVRLSPSRSQRPSWCSRSAAERRGS